jgi:hypothetical protein
MYWYDSTAMHKTLAHAEMLNMFVCTAWTPRIEDQTPNVNF